jgi:hypothetical protein
MKRIRYNAKKLLVITLTMGCMALVLVWPQWRNELKAQGYGYQFCRTQYFNCRDAATNRDQIDACIKQLDNCPFFAESSFLETGIASPIQLLKFDLQQPGSVIVFPKFIKGSVNLPEGGTAPATEIEVGIVCPTGATCPEQQSVKIRFHWVCPGDQSFADKLTCRESDFDVIGSVNEKLVLVPNGAGTSDGVGTRFVPPPPCPMGYLIGWVVNTNDQPIKFDGLIGDAVLRVSGSALSAYNAIPIQAEPALENGALITLGGRFPDSLVFDGGPGHYQAVTGTIIGDVRYSNVSGPTTITTTYITLLTLDTISNRPNFPTFVDLFFYGGFGSAIGAGNVLSTFTQFVCWTEQRIDVDIDPALRTSVMGRKGVVISDPAEKIQWGGISDTAGPVTLLGLIETIEGPTVGSAARSDVTSVSNGGAPVATQFEP